MPYHLKNSDIVLNNIARIYFDRGDERALETAKSAYQLAPDRAEVIDTYGWMLVQDGEIKKGLHLLERAIDRAPTNDDIRYHWAAALNLTGERENARVELERTLNHQRPFFERESAEALLEKLK